MGVDHPLVNIPLSALLDDASQAWLDGSVIEYAPKLKRGNKLRVLPFSIVLQDREPEWCSFSPDLATVTLQRGSTHALRWAGGAPPPNVTVPPQAPKAFAPPKTPKAQDGGGGGGGGAAIGPNGGELPPMGVKKRKREDGLRILELEKALEDALLRATAAEGQAAAAEARAAAAEARLLAQDGGAPPAP